MADDPRVGYMKPADKPPAKKSAAKKAVAAGKKAASQSSGGVAGATVAKGGGPENPVADVAAAKTVAAQAKEARAQRADVRAERREARASHSFAQRQADRQRAGGGVQAPKAEAKTPGGGRKVIGWAWSGNRKLLTAEFLLCIIVLFLGTMTAPPGSKDDVHRAMVKGSALSGLFMLLALVSAGGKSAAKAATALGTLISAAYLFTSSDVHNLTAWLSGFFGKGGPAWSAGQAADSALGGTDSQAQDFGSVFAQAGAEADQGSTSGEVTFNGVNEGSVDGSGGYTSTNGYSY